MTRRSNHAHADDFPPPKKPSLGVVGLGLFDPPAEAPPVPPPTPPVGVIPETESVAAQRRREKVSALHEAGSRRWINTGKPVVLAVLRAQGRVTAETWRNAAEHVKGALPPSYGVQRTLSYVSRMFAELVREGHIEKLLRSDGSVVKEYSSESRNEQVVYVLTGDRGTR